MANWRVVLINENRMRPPVAPLALDYLGDTLLAAGIDVDLVDLSFEPYAASAIRSALSSEEPLVVGISFRNTDDCYYPSCAWFVPRLKELVDTVRSLTDAPIVIGGCGFSIMPVPVLERVGADMAVTGDGEATFLRLVQHLVRGESYANLPGVIHRQDNGHYAINPPQYAGDMDVPPGRSLVDNARYLREGAMGNIETKRGCPMPCIYCADPLAKGAVARLRKPAQVADEIEALLRQGVDVLHLCDGEFNIPPKHALAVCKEMRARGLGSRVQWYCYASVHPFPRELAGAMRRAGCVGVNFGVDSGCDRMLDALGRGYTCAHIRATVHACKEAGLTVMLDLLLGGPGEDEDSVRETIEFIRALDPARAGAATGVRVYPGTPLARQVAAAGPLADNPNLRGHVADNDDLVRPIFFFDRRLGDDPGALVCDLIGNDERFFPPPRLQDARNYNYNDNRVLEQAIAEGHRGAFWDILRRIT